MPIHRADFLSHLEKIIDNKVLDSRKYMESIERSIHSESKSTAGDKHDTSRELMQQERNKAAQNLSNQLAIQKTLIQLKLIDANVAIGLGSLIETQDNVIFIRFGLGERYHLNQEVVCISPLSPLARALEGMQVGEVCTFNEVIYEIKRLLK